jgi:hypothetical protein
VSSTGDSNSNSIPSVDGKDEYKLFARLLVFELKRFEENEMALKWMDFVDGVTGFPETPPSASKVPQAVGAKSPSAECSRENKVGARHA